MAKNKREARRLEKEPWTILFEMTDCPIEDFERLLPSTAELDYPKKQVLEDFSRKNPYTHCCLTIKERRGEKVVWFAVCFPPPDGVGDTGRAGSSSEYAFVRGEWVGTMEAEFGG